MNEKGFKSEKEWFEQAEYDIKSADIMFKGGRYIYSVFMPSLHREGVKGYIRKKI